MILSIKNYKKTNNDLPGQAGHWDLHLPDRVSYLPRAVGQSLLSYPDLRGGDSHLDYLITLLIQSSKFKRIQQLWQVDANRWTFST